MMDQTFVIFGTLCDYEKNMLYNKGSEMLFIIMSTVLKTVGLLNQEFRNYLPYLLYSRVNENVKL